MVPNKVASMGFNRQTGLHYVTPTPEYSAEVAKHTFRLVFHGRDLGTGLSVEALSEALYQFAVKDRPACSEYCPHRCPGRCLIALCETNNRRVSFGFDGLIDYAP